VARWAVGESARGQAGRAIALVMVLALGVGMLVARGTDSASSAVVTSTLVPVADAYAESTTATANYGANARIIVDASPIRQTFIRFDLSGFTAPLQSARLRMHVSSVTDSASPSGGNVAQMFDTAWSETDVTYNNRPTAWGPNM
jgi:hypothetical protein